MGVVFAFVLAIVLLGVSGFASGSEIAFFSLSPSDISELDLEKSLKDKNINMLREDSERTLATILITNNFVNVTIIMLLNYVFANVVHFGPRAYWLQFLILTILLTFLLLLFGEIMPKVLSRQKPLVFCRRSVTGILFFRKLFWPLETVLLKTGMLAEKMMGKESVTLSVDDLEQALELTNKEDLKDEEKLLQGIIRFGDETAKEIMTSRKDIVDIDIKCNFSEVLESIKENNYSRIPIYQDNTDNIKGVLYVKDLLPHLTKPHTFRWQSLIRPPYFVPETKKIDDLLRDFQENKIHIAIVVDEFGGTSGLVTLEDILEEIVGEIRDEFDQEEENIQQVTDKIYDLKGDTLIEEINSELSVNIPLSEEYDTISGYFQDKLGKVAEISDHITGEGYILKVMEVDNMRVEKIRIVITGKDNEENEDGRD